MARFGSLGSGLAKGIATGSAIKQQKEEFEELKATRRQAGLHTALTDARDTSIAAIEKAAETAAEVASNPNATDEQLEALREVARGSAASYATTIENIMERAKAANASPDEMAMIQQQFGSPQQFIETHMGIFESKVEAGKANRVVDLTPEEVAAANFPEGSIVQRKPDGSIDLLFNPAKDQGVLQQRIDALSQIMTPEQAIGVAGGAHVLSTNPITGEAEIVNKGTGEKVGSVDIQPEASTAPPLVDPNIDAGAALGAKGAFTAAINTVGDVFGLGLASPEASEASAALNTIQQTSKLAMQAVVPGRPAKDIREGLEKLTVTPNSFLQGEEDAKIKFAQQKRMVDAEIARMETSLASGAIDKVERRAVNENLGQLKEMSESYETIISSLGGAVELRSSAKQRGLELLDSGDLDAAEELIEAIKAGDDAKIAELMGQDDGNR